MKKLTDKLQSSDLETRPGRTMLETFEDEVNQALNKARDDSGKEAQRSLDSTNNVVRMVSAGSKGSFINISQARPLQASGQLWLFPPLMTRPTMSCAWCPGAARAPSSTWWVQVNLPATGKNGVCPSAQCRVHLARKH